MRGIRCMSTISIPPLGDSITEATVVEFTKNVGDPVHEDEVLAILETDKVSVDIFSSADGVITEILVEEGDTVLVAQDIITIDTDQAVPAKESASPSIDPTVSTVSSSSSDAISSDTATPSPRVPLIHFKYGSQSVDEPPSSSSSPLSPSPPITTQDGVIHYESFDDLPPQFHRRRGLTEDQIRMIETGGAEPEDYSYPL